MLNEQNYQYKFYPCAYIATRNDNQLLHYRMKTRAEVNAADNTFKAFATRSGAYIDCPDRELFFTRGAHVSNSDRPFGWDGTLFLGWLYNTGDDYPGDRFMINHTGMSAMDMRMDIRGEMEPTITSNKTVICDSGGFQLRSGTKQWIDPRELAEFYNGFVDQGITLDIPVVSTDKELLQRAVRVQKLNSKMIIENLAEEVQLANVSHGIGAEEFTFVREQLWEDERMDILCIPSSVMIPELNSIDRLTYHLSHGMKYNQYHLLGVYNPSWLSIAIRLIYRWNKEHGTNVLLTSDASSAVYSAKSLRFHKQMMLYRSVSRWAIGMTAPLGRHINTGKHLNCQCPVCQTIKYVDVMNILGDTNIAPFLTRHNELETIRWAQMTCEAAETMDDMDYIEYTSYQAGPRGSSRGIRDAFEYMDRFFAHGWEKTHAHYATKLSTLFGLGEHSDAVFDEEPRDQMPTEGQTPEQLHAHHDRILSRYERFHKTGKAPMLSAEDRKSSGMAESLGATNSRTAVKNSKKRK